MSVVIRRFIVAPLLLVALTTGAQVPSGPLATVEGASSRIIGILQDPAVPRAERWSRIAPVIREHFDFFSMSQSILAREWKTATQEQQRQFADYFAQYIEGTYRSKIEAYSDQRIEYTGEKIRGNRASVSSVIHADAVKIPVDYFLRRSADGAWRAYDVAIEGVSLVNSYRELYAAISRTSGISGVIAHVRRQAADRRPGAVSGASTRVQ